MTEMFEAYKQICNPTDCIDGSGARIPGCVLPKCARVRVDTSANTFTNRDIELEWLPSPVVAKPADLPPNPPPTPAQQAAHDAAFAAYIENQTKYAWKRSYRDGVAVYYNASTLTGDPDAAEKLRNFNDLADAHGISDVTTP